MTEWFPMPTHLLEGLWLGGQRSREAVGQRERLLALGSLTAGLTHELNNPAAAAVRATVTLRERVAAMRGKLKHLAAGKYERGQPRDDRSSFSSARSSGSPRRPSSPRSRRPTWKTRCPTGSMSAASPTAGSYPRRSWRRGCRPSGSTRCGTWSATPMLESALRWLNYTVETELLMNEIEDATTRISTLVGDAKQYSQLDRAPFQVVDVHDLLDSTLLMMSAKIGPTIKVVKDYDRSLPGLPGYASELNQVWTNMIDNAVSAMGGTGTLTIRTARDGDCALIEIGDTGPGIPADIRNRIFEPFFSTKPVGEGTGLGLDIAWRIVVNKHHGDLQVESEPGDTRFQIRLPLEAHREHDVSGGNMTEMQGVDPSVPPSGPGCVECEADQGWWLHLRRCTQCGHIGCCDNSPAQHATRHAKETGHPVIRSYEPGEEWFWSYPNEDFYETGPELAAPMSHPARSADPRPGRPRPAQLAVDAEPVGRTS